MNQHEPGAKLDNGKVNPSLVFDGFPKALLAVAELATFGAQKYSPGGWRQVVNGFDRYTAAMDRHRLQETFQEFDRDWLDDYNVEVRHVTAVAWNALARLELLLGQDGLGIGDL